MAKPNDPDKQGQVLTKERTSTTRPRMYKVLIHNDDYTPMEFVVAILRQVFRLNEVDATRVMLHVHHQGVGVAGVFTHQVAETKMHQVVAAAKRHEFPLQCSMEPEDWNESSS